MRIYLSNMVGTAGSGYKRNNRSLQFSWVYCVERVVIRMRLHNNKNINNNNNNNNEQNRFNVHRGRRIHTAQHGRPFFF